MMDLTSQTPVLKPGDVVDERYAIRAQVAQGGMGTVFLAEHVRIKRRLALKVLHPALAADTRMVRRFMNEAMAAGSLGHPNIVEATDMGFTLESATHGRVPFIVFEYVDGVQLSDEIYRAGGLPVVRALEIARQIASALATAHEAGIVHLDLKSDNILLAEGDRDHVKVLDFGISRFLKLDSKTTRGLVMGTPEFMAPEQISAPETVDERADIYALGIVLYEMLVARLPYENTDPRILLYRIVNEDPPRLDKAFESPELDRAIDALIFEKLIAKDRTQRFQTMREVGAALDTLLERARTKDVVEIVPVAPISEGESGEPKAARRIGSLLGLAVIAAMAGGVAKYGEHRMQVSATDAAEASVHEHARLVGEALESQLAAARERVSAIATSEPLVAALASPRPQAAVQELAKKGAAVPPRSDETVEIFQLRKAKLTSVWRLPAEAVGLDTGPVPALIEAAMRDDQPYVQLDGEAGTLRIVAAMAVPDGKTAGVVATSTVVDLSHAQQQLAIDTQSTTLVGLERPIDLVRPTRVVEGLAVDAPIALSPAAPHTGPLALSTVVVPRPRGRTFRTTSQVAFLGAGMLLICFGVIRKQR